MLRKRMNNFIEAVKLSLETQNWYSALILGLTLPDICGRLKSPDKGSKERYIDWFDTYIKDNFTFKRPHLHYSFKADIFIEIPHDVISLTGNDCYALRCSYLHEDREEIEQQKSVALDSAAALQLQIDLFCLLIIEGVDKWIDDYEQDPDIQARAESLLHIKEFN